MTVAVHQKLQALGIAHVFDDYGPGTHSWPYWARDLRETLPGFMNVLASPPAPPSRVTFTAIEPRYEAYGWQVTLDRPVLEFSRLENAGADGFTLAGSGTGQVVTPASYVAGAAYRVGSALAAADATGRLHVRVDLGPADTTQEYRPGADTKVRRVTVAIASAAAGAPAPAAVPCSSRRRIRVTVPRRLRRTRVTMAGRRLRVHGSRRPYVIVDLRGRRAGVYRVRMGSRVVRSFRTCARARGGR
jgi:hypothetical protein